MELPKIMIQMEMMKLHWRKERKPWHIDSRFAITRNIKCNLSNLMSCAVFLAI